MTTTVSNMQAPLPGWINVTQVMPGYNEMVLRGFEVFAANAEQINYVQVPVAAYGDVVHKLQQSTMLLVIVGVATLLMYFTRK